MALKNLLQMVLVVTPSMTHPSFASKQSVKVW